MGNTESYYSCDFVDRNELIDEKSFNEKFQCILRNFNENTPENDDIKNYLIVQMSIYDLIDMNKILSQTKIENVYITEIVTNKIKPISLKDFSSNNYFLFIIGHENHQTSLIVDKIEKKITYYNSTIFPGDLSLIDFIRTKLIFPVFGELLSFAEFTIKVLNGNQVISKYCRSYSYEFIFYIIKQLNENKSLNYELINNFSQITDTENLCKYVFTSYKKIIFSEDDKVRILDFINAYHLIYLLNRNNSVLNLDENIISNEELKNEDFIVNIYFLIKYRYRIVDKRIIEILCKLLFFDKSILLEEVLCKYTYKERNLKKDIITPEENFFIDFYKDENTIITLKDGLKSYNKFLFNNIDKMQDKNKHQQCTLMEYLKNNSREGEMGPGIKEFIIQQIIN